jgi:hypothetical protein
MLQSALYALSYKTTATRFGPAEMYLAELLARRPIEIIYRFQA